MPDPSVWRSLRGSRRRCAIGPLAYDLQLSDPARRVFLRANGLVVNLRVVIGDFACQEQEDQPYHLVRQSDDRLFVRLAHHQASIFGCQRAFGLPGRVGAFTHDVADDRTGLADAC